MNLHLSQNGQDGEVGSQSGPKYQNEGKRKTPDEGFSDYEDNCERDIRKSKSKKKKKSLKGHKRSERKRSSSSSTSSSSSSSTSSSGLDSSADDEEERSKPNSNKHKTSNLDEAMFHLQTEEEKHKCNLPKKLLKYADHYLKKFIPTPSLTLTPCTL